MQYNRVVNQLRCLCHFIFLFSFPRELPLHTRSPRFRCRSNESIDHYAPDTTYINVGTAIMIHAELYYL